jgi:hypothetical protein
VGGFSVAFELMERKSNFYSHDNTILNAGIEYGIIALVGTARKITVEIPGALLDKAQQASGTGITQTVRTGLQLLAASQAYKSLRQMRGKVRFARTLVELKSDR